MLASINTRLEDLATVSAGLARDRGSGGPAAGLPLRDKASPPGPWLESRPGCLLCSCEDFTTVPLAGGDDSSCQASFAWR